jgi:voltage-dependent calcium channel
MFFGILFMETFSLTKWGVAENHNQNYSTMGKALVMLAFMTSGYVLLRVYAEYVHFAPDGHFSVKVGINTCTICEQILFCHGPPVFVLLTVLCSTHTYPRCTNSIPNVANSDSDCGSTGWAYTLFIAWNILSMVGCPLLPRALTTL